MATDPEPGSQPQEVRRGRIGPWLVYVILGLIVLLITLFLVFHPRGPDAGSSRLDAPVFTSQGQVSSLA